jgi:hypothetical protein
MKKGIKYIAVLLFAAMSLILFSGCAGTVELKQPPVDSGVTAIEVKGTCTIEKTGSTIKVSGDSNLMDGVIVKFTVDSFNGVELASKTFTKSGDNGSAEFAIDPSWKGIVYGSMVCSPNGAGDQSKEVFAKYGQKFQNIRGNNVIWDANGNIFVAQSEKLDLGA